MDIHEYQAKEILSEFSVNVPRGGLAYSPEQAVYRAGEIGGEQFLVKAQIHSGARNKAGGIKSCNGLDAVRKSTAELMGKRLVTDQTGPDGQMVHRVYIEESIQVRKEYYLAFLLDRQLERVVVIGSAHGGIDIEQQTRDDPDSIIRIAIEPAVGMQAFQARQLVFKLGIEKSMTTQAVTAILGCYRAFRDLDATLIEINPLALSSEGVLVALDAKMSFDDNALFRRPRIANMRDKYSESPLARKAADRGLDYIGLDGSIGCIINSAGLAMATIDMIHLVGGKPANFIDIGPDALPDRVNKAVNLQLQDSRVKVILVNIFAGINRCDWIAEGLIKAVRRHGSRVPVIVRLAGTNAKTGKRSLAESGVAVTIAGSLRDAAEKAVAAARGTGA